MGGNHADWLADNPGDQRPCWLEVDLDAIAANVGALRRLIGPRTRLCAVVKADAYGLGAAEVGPRALAGGADLLAVARVEEAARLRGAGIRAPILLLAGFCPAEAPAIVRLGVWPTLVNVDQVLAVARAARRAGATVPVHVKVDTGLSRYGASPREALRLVPLVRSLPSLRLDGVYTHFAAADEADLAFTERQLAEFLRLAESLGLRDDPSVLLHAANSAGALALPASRLDMVRLGITLSGHYPSPASPPVAGLQPAVSFKARLARVFELAAGDSIGYGRTFVASRPMRAGLVLAGYADGVPRAHSNRAFAAIRGVRVPLVGRVSMDQFVVDLSSRSDCAPGDVVTLFGASRGEPITLEEFAGWSDTIGHEALCRIGPRVPRLYRQAGRARWGGDELGREAALAARL